MHWFISLFFTFSVLSANAFAQNQSAVSQTTRDALLHVVAHEIGHAIIREFDLPVLGPEEDIADDFATVYIYMMFPERADEIITARARQNLADNEQPGMFSEYRADNQRAGRSVCMLYGLNPDRFPGLAGTFALSGDEAANCRDFATEVGRSWRRIIADYRMPAGVRITEARIRSEDTPQIETLVRTNFVDDAYKLLSGIDWHSNITLSIEQCDGATSWSRNGRRITLCDAYIQRFEEQLGR